MIESIRSRIAVALFAILGAAFVVIVLLPFITSGNISNCCNSSDSSILSKRVIAYSTIYSTNNKMNYTFSYARIQDIAPNSAVHFLSPFGNSMARFPHGIENGNLYDLMNQDQKIAFINDADAFEQYVLIRLPKELGGNSQNVSAFRAYSDLDPESKCLLGYRGFGYSFDANSNYEITSFLEDPCHSDIFRVTDGYSCFGRIAFGTNPALGGYNALPRMKMSMDREGYLTAIKPDGQPNGDGTVGEGRIMPIEEIGNNDSDPSCNFVKSR